MLLSLAVGTNGGPRVKTEEGQRAALRGGVPGGRQWALAVESPSSPALSSGNLWLHRLPLVQSGPLGKVMRTHSSF